MRNKQLAKRVFAVILAASLSVTAAPMPVMAEEEPAVQQQEQEQPQENSDVSNDVEQEDKQEENAESEPQEEAEDKPSEEAENIDEKDKISAQENEVREERSAEAELQEEKEQKSIEFNGKSVSKSELKKIFTEEMGITYPAAGTTQLRNTNTGEEIKIADGLIATGTCNLESGTYEVRTRKTLFSLWEIKATVDIKIFYNVNFTATGASGGGILVNGEEVSTAKVYENQQLTFQTKEVAGYEATVKNGENVLKPDENGNYVINNVTENTDISVVYEAKQGSKVTVAVPENGTVKVNGMEKAESVIPYGDEINIEAIPDSGYAVEKITINDKDVEADFANCIGTVQTIAEESTDYNVKVTFQKVELKAKSDRTISWREGQAAKVTEQRIFDTVLDTENSVPSGIAQENVKIEYDAEHISGTVWKAIDYIPSGLDKVHEHAFGNNPRNIIEKVENIRITYAGNDKYPSVSLEAKIYLDDKREASKIEVTEGASITYSSDEEAVKEALYQALNPVVKDAATEEVIQTESKDFTFEYEKLAVGTVNVTIKYNGNDDYDSSEISVDVAVTKAKASVIVNSQNIVYGEKFAPVFSANPVDAKVIGMIAGLDSKGAGYVSIDFASITLNDLVGKDVPIMGNWSLQKILNDYLHINSFQLRNLTDIIQKIAEIPGVGDLSQLISSINEAIDLIDKFAPGVLDTTVSLGGTPFNAGIYMAVGVTANQNYKTALGVGTLTVTPQTSNLELRFNEELPKGDKLSISEAETFNFGGQLYDKETDEQVDGANIKCTYVGVKSNGEPVGSTEPAREPGRYVETVYVSFGNHAVLPIVRDYKVAREDVTMEVTDAKTTYDGEEHPVKVVLRDKDGNEILQDETIKDKIKCTYVNIFSGIEISKEAPIDAGSYSAFVTFEGTDKYEDVKLKTGHVVINRVKYAEIQISDQDTIYGDELQKAVYGETYEIIDERIPEKDREGILKEIHCEEETHPVGEHKIVGTLRDGLNRNYKHIEVLPGTHNVSAKNVVVDFVDESGNQVFSTNVEKREGNPNAFEKAELEKYVPAGWVLVGQDAIEITENVIGGVRSFTSTVVLREKKYTKEVTVKYVTEDGEPVGDDEILTIEKDYDYIETSWLEKVPEYYEIVNEGKVTIQDGVAEVVVRKAMKTVMVNFVDESGNPVLSKDIEVESDATELAVSLIKDFVPSGWELVSEGELPIKDNAVTVVLREKEYTKDVTVKYVTEAGKEVGTESVTVEKDATAINTSWLKEVPKHYELAEVGDFPISKDNVAEVPVRKAMKTVMVNFVDESGNPVLSKDIEVESDATYFNTSLIEEFVPSGWELKEVGDIAINKDNTATVVLREKEYTKDVTVKYVTEAGKEVGTESVTVEKDATAISTSWLKEVPKHYELAEVGDFPISKDNVAEVPVRKAMKTVMVNFVDESGNPVLSKDIEVESDAIYFNTSMIQEFVPSGWELKEVGDIAINKDNTATVVLREKEYTKDVTVKYVTEAGKEVGTESVTVEKDATAINTSWLKEVPKHYELAEVGDFPISKDNVAEVPVRKAMKTVMVNFVDESGNPVLSKDIEVESDATYFNTSMIQEFVPSGWELKEVGDIAINKDNTATVVLREKEHTEDILVKYVTEDGEEVAEGTLKVEKGSTSINTSWLQDVPEGYEVAVVGDLPIKDGIVEVVVRMIEEPEEPEEPENPDIPEDPDKPNKPDKPVNPDKPNKPNKPAKPSKPSDSNKPSDSDKAPKTGDTAPIGLLGFGMAASIAAIAAIIVSKKRR